MPSPICWTGMRWDELQPSCGSCSVAFPPLHDHVSNKSSPPWIRMQSHLGGSSCILTINQQECVKPSFIPSAFLSQSSLCTFLVMRPLEEHAIPCHQSAKFVDSFCWARQSAIKSTKTLALHQVSPKSIAQITFVFRFLCQFSSPLNLLQKETFKWNFLLTK